MRTRLATLLALTAVVGCIREEADEPAPPRPAAVFTPADPPAADPATALSADDLCVMYAVAVNYGGYTCEQGYSFTSQQLDPFLAGTVCRPGTSYRNWADRLLAAAEAQRVHIDWAQARECYAASLDLRLHNTGLELAAQGDLEALWKKGVCSTFYSGLVKRGDACEDDWECAGKNDGCYTADPTAPNSRTCRLGGGDGEWCASEYLPCRQGFWCNDESQCAAQGELGAACLYHDQCLSGMCGPTGCETPPAGKALGEACESAAECEPSACVTCRRLADGEPPVCALVGSQGDYCEAAAGCARDLGCTGGVCTTVGPFAECGTSETGVCDPNLTCIDMDGCLLKSGNPTLCSADARCIFDDGDGYCYPRVGRCMALPVAGPCMGPVGYCAPGFLCDADSETCEPLKRDGEACTAIGGYSDCADGYACVQGVCQLECISDRDCVDGEVCRLPNANLGETWPAVCVPRATSECTRTSECGAGRYCLFPEEICPTLTAEPSCSADIACRWDDTSVCLPATTAVARCEDQLPTGAVVVGYCDIGLGGFGYSEACRSGNCYSPDIDAPILCSEPSNYGCYGNDFVRDMIGYTFVFGLLWTRRRRRSPTL